MSKQVRLQWVPGHAGIGGNEGADRDAKASRSYTQITNIPASVRDLSNQITPALFKYWQYRWDSCKSSFSIGSIKLNGDWKL